MSMLPPYFLSFCLCKSNSFLKRIKPSLHSLLVWLKFYPVPFAALVDVAVSGCAIFTKRILICPIKFFIRNTEVGSPVVMSNPIYMIYDFIFKEIAREHSGHNDSRHPSANRLAALQSDFPTFYGTNIAAIYVPRIFDEKINILQINFNYVGNIHGL